METITNVTPADIAAHVLPMLTGRKWQVCDVGMAGYLYMRPVFRRNKLQLLWADSIGSGTFQVSDILDVVVTNENGMVYLVDSRSKTAADCGGRVRRGYQDLAGQLDPRMVDEANHSTLLAEGLVSEALPVLAMATNITDILDFCDSGLSEIGTDVLRGLLALQ